MVVAAHGVRPLTPVLLGSRTSFHRNDDKTLFIIWGILNSAALFPECFQKTFAFKLFEKGIVVELFDFSGDGLIRQ